MEKNRRFLRFYDKDEYEVLVPESDEKKQRPFPLFQKAYDEKKPLIDLIPILFIESGSILFIGINKYYRFFLINLAVSIQLIKKKNINISKHQFSLKNQ